MMDKQFKIYSVDTKSFYGAEEEKINKQIAGCNIIINLIKEFVLLAMIKPKIGKKGKVLKGYTKYTFSSVADLHKQKKNDKYVKQFIKKVKKENKDLMKSDDFEKKLKDYKFYCDYIEHELEITLTTKGKKKTKNKKNKLEELNSQLNNLIKINTNVRELNPKKVSKYNLISLFDSDLSRILELKVDKTTTDLLVVRVYQYPILEQLINKGYNYLGEHFICLTASAGNIRQKKVLFVKGKVWNKIQDTITNGLSKKAINESEEKGCNINKFLSYLSLCSTSSHKIEGFDINKCIVIRDFETVLKDRKVDYIDNVTFEVTKDAKKDITITHSDGCGWVLPSVSKKSFQIRMPWFKGLVTPVNFLNFCKLNNNSNYKVTDIYGDEKDLLADGIEYVFSESQFKMHKYYKDWKEYQENFIKYNCNANYCNKEENFSDFRKGKFSYQMWQTLTDISDDEIKEFTDPIDKFVTDSYTDADTMLRMLGANKENKKKDYFQQALELYPELLKDSYVKNQLGSAISKVKKDAKSGKIKIPAKNTFLIPDVFAWMQFIFLGKDKVTGLLKDGEVSCKLFKKEPQLLVERSPHLYKEEAVRVNKINAATNKWFISNGIFTSCFDLINLILQFDNDGDHALVVTGKLVEIAERNTKNVLPLYYEMGFAKPKQITPANIYTGLTEGFKYSNIGQFSNKLTALWNKEEITDEDLDTAKVITALNNYCIDASKTLEMKTLVKGSTIDTAVKKINKLPLPYFFQFAKDKEVESVDKINNSTVNEICNNIQNIKQDDFNFDSVGTFRSAKLMHNPKIELFVKEYNEGKKKFLPDVDINEMVINKYNRMNKEMQKYFFKNEAMEKDEIGCAVWLVMKQEFEDFCEDFKLNFVDAVDIIIKNVYKNSKNSKKKLLFNVFGDVIVENLNKNIKKPEAGYLFCRKCGKKTERESNSQTMCPKCREENIKRQNNNRNKKKVV